MKNIPQPYTLKIFIDCINREIAKRRVTYPKLLHSKQAKWATIGLDVQKETAKLSFELGNQYGIIGLLRMILEGRPPVKVIPVDNIFRELQRELRLRKQCYPRWIKWGMIDSESAKDEIDTWTALTHWFHQEYCPDATWRKPPVRKNKSV